MCTNFGVYPDSKPEEGSAHVAGGQNLGALTSVAQTPEGDHVGLAYLRCRSAPFLVFGFRINIESGLGPSRPITLVDSC